MTDTKIMATADIGGAYVAAQGEIDGSECVLLTVGRPGLHNHVYLTASEAHDLIDALKEIAGEERPVEVPVFEGGDRVVVLSGSYLAGEIVHIIDGRPDRDGDVSIRRTDGGPKFIRPEFLAKLA